VRPGRSFLDILKGEDDDGDDDADFADHPIAELVRLLVAAGNKPDTAAALHHLRATLPHRTRTHKAAKDDSMDTVHAIMKDGGIAGVCAAIVAKGHTGFSEAELVSAASAVAAERWPELSPAQAFSRVYSAGTDEARVLQHALSVAKAAEFSVFDVTPLVVGGAAAQDVDDPAEAVAQLRQIGRNRWPTASEADQFERALTDPANHVIARKAVPIPRATTSFPFSR
jgi:hypothetical protein